MPIYLGNNLVNNSIIGNQIVSEIQSGRRILPCNALTIRRNGTGSRTLNYTDCYSGKPRTFTWNNAQTYRIVYSSFTDPGGVIIGGDTNLYNPSYPENQFPTPCNCQNITVDSGVNNGYFSYVPCNGDTAVFEISPVNTTACVISGSIAVAGATITINSDCSNC